MNEYRRDTAHRLRPHPDSKARVKGDKRPKPPQPGRRPPSNHTSLAVMYMILLPRVAGTKTRRVRAREMRLIGPYARERPRDPTEANGGKRRRRRKGRHSESRFGPKESRGKKIGKIEDVIMPRDREGRGGREGSGKGGDDALASP